MGSQQSPSDLSDGFCYTGNMNQALSKYSALLLLTPDGKLIFHHRDNKPGIANPNQIGMYGGGVEENESYEQAALRELHEELGISISGDKLKFYVDYTKIKDIHGINQQCKVFIIRDVETATLQPNPNEGQGFVLVSIDQDISNLNMTIMAQDIFSIYKNKI